MEFPIKKKWTGKGTEQGKVTLFTDYYYGIDENDKEVILSIPCTDYRWVDVEDENDFFAERKIRKNTFKYGAHSIQEEREEDYGDAQESFGSIAKFWENYLNRKTGLDFNIDAIDVALMMTLFKISRNAYKRKEDNFVDGESYANFATRFFEEQ